MPIGALFGISVGESGNAAPLVGGPPGRVLHPAVDGLPSAGAGDTVPVVLPRIGSAMVPSAAEVDDVCAVGVEQVTTVPGVVGSEASGTGASVVSGAPG